MEQKTFQFPFQRLLLYIDVPRTEALNDILEKKIGILLGSYTVMRVLLSSLMEQIAICNHHASKNKNDAETIFSHFFHSINGLSDVKVALQSVFQKEERKICDFVVMALL